jgi:hypothetical protein
LIVIGCAEAGGASSLGWRRVLPDPMAMEIVKIRTTIPNRSHVMSLFLGANKIW